MNTPIRVARAVVIGTISLVIGAVSAHAQFTNQAMDRLGVMGVSPTSAALVQYAAQGDSATVELLLAAGVSPKTVEPTRRVTALHTAASQGHLRLVERLIELGAEVDASDWQGITPLIAACAVGHRSVVKALLRGGAKIDVVPVSAPTALIAAIQSGNAALVDELLSAGASPRLADSFKTTPLLAAQRANRQPLVSRLEAAK